MQGLGDTADLWGDGFDRGLRRRILTAGVLYHADGPLTDFWGKLAVLVHGSILSKAGASSKPGAVQGILAHKATLEEMVLHFLRRRAVDPLETTPHKRKSLADVVQDPQPLCFRHRYRGPVSQDPGG